MQSILIVVLLGVLSSVSATPLYNDTEYDLSSIVHNCLQEHPIGLKKITEMFGNVTWEGDTPVDIPDSEELRSILACALKKIGAMDDKGKLNKAGLQKLLLMYFHDHPEDKDTNYMTEIDDLVKRCLKLNDEPVKDGNKGFERVGKLYNFLKSVGNSSDDSFPDASLSSNSTEK